MSSLLSVELDRDLIRWLLQNIGKQEETEEGLLIVLALEDSLARDDSEE